MNEAAQPSHSRSMSNSIHGLGPQRVAMPPGLAYAMVRLQLHGWQIENRRWAKCIHGGGEALLPFGSSERA